MIALMSLLVVGALFVFILSFRSVYRTFSTPIRPVSTTSAIAPYTPAPAPAMGDSLTKELFGSAAGTKEAPVMDGPTLRALLSLQGVDQKALSTMTDEQLLKSYQEFMDRFSKGSSPK